MATNGKINTNPSGSSHGEQLVPKRLTLMVMMNMTMVLIQRWQWWWWSFIYNRSCLSVGHKSDYLRPTIYPGPAGRRPAVDWGLQHQVAPPNFYQLFFCSHWSIIWENIWVCRSWIDFELLVIFKISKFPLYGHFSKLSQTYGVTYQNLGEKGTKPPEKN